MEKKNTYMVTGHCEVIVHMEVNADSGENAIKNAESAYKGLEETLDHGVRPFDNDDAILTVDDDKCVFDDAYKIDQQHIDIIADSIVLIQTIYNECNNQTYYAIVLKDIIITTLK